MFHQGTIEPISIIHIPEQEWHERAAIVIPLVACLVAITVFMVAILLYCKRHRDNLLYKGNICNVDELENMPPCNELNQKPEYSHHLTCSNRYSIQNLRGMLDEYGMGMNGD